VLRSGNFSIIAAKKLIWDAQTAREVERRNAASRRKRDNRAPTKVRGPVLYVGFRLHFGDDSLEVSQRLLDGERIHFTSDSFAGLKRGL
jgi:hypothetical protein